MFASECSVYSCLKKDSQITKDELKLGGKYTVSHLKRPILNAQVPKQRKKVIFVQTEKTAILVGTLHFLQFGSFKIVIFKLFDRKN